MEIKFASIPTLYAPKVKMVNFAMPKWRNKMGQFSDPDVLSWVDNIYQSKVFKTRDAFNKAYDSHDDYAIHWRNKPMVITTEDAKTLDEIYEEGGFDDGPKVGVSKLLKKITAVFETGEKTIFVY